MGIFGVNSVSLFTVNIAHGVGLISGLLKVLENTKKRFFSSKAFLPGVPGFSCIINKLNYSVMFTMYLMFNNRAKYHEVSHAYTGRALFS